MKCHLFLYNILLSKKILVIFRYITNDTCLNNVTTTGDVSINANLFVDGLSTFNNNITILKDASFNNLFVKGDASLNNLYVTNDSSFNTNLYVQNDVSINNNLKVGNRAIFTKNPFI